MRVFLASTIVLTAALTLAPAGVAAPPDASGIRTAAPAFFVRLAAEPSRLDREAARLAMAPPMPRIGPGPLLRPGVQGIRVVRLAARLTAFGFPVGHRTRHYGPALSAAVAAFERAEGLNIDGVAGPAVLARLDLDRTARMAALRLTAARMRAFLARPRKGTFILANIPSARVVLVERGQKMLTMRAVVGAPWLRTPLMNVVARDVILNPTWTVPTQIIRREILPVLRRTGRTGIPDARIFVDGRQVRPASIDWRNVAARRVRIVQAAGPWNALGLYKLELIDPYEVYMHGTDDPAALRRDARAISHGCIRLAHPRRMADRLLERAGWTKKRVAALEASGKTLWIRLPKAVPVHVVYWTAAIRSGRVVYYPDVYGYDTRAARLAMARSTMKFAGLGDPVR